MDKEIIMEVHELLIKVIVTWTMPKRFKIVANLYIILLKKQDNY